MLYTITAVSLSTLAILLAGIAALIARRLREKQDQRFTELCAAVESRDQAQAKRDQYFAELCDAVESRDQALAEVERIRERHHTHATVEMLEDLSSVLLDIDVETRQFIQYLVARLKHADQIITAGRPSPYSYQPVDTSNRPPRPGAVPSNIKLWRL